MTATITPERWVAHMEADYLTSFIREGGSCVKFAVPTEPDVATPLFYELERASSLLGYLYVHASAAAVRMHMIHELFYAIAKQVPWVTLCRKVLLDVADGLNYAVPDVACDEPIAEAVAAANDMDRDYVFTELRQKVVHHVLKDVTLARDFRVAMAKVCVAQLTGGTEGTTTAQVVTDWLSGANTSVAAVRPYGIQSRVNRSNARYFVESTLAWVRHAGLPGIIATLDIGAVTVPKRSDSNELFYTKAAVLDCYEVFRQFIDDTDNLEGLFLVVVPAKEFLEVDPPTRGMGCYEALKFRIYDEVRDRTLANPMASLVRLSGARYDIS